MDLSPKQQKVARLLAEESSYIALGSAADVPTRTGVDIATVVRTCQRLGYTGWRELLSEVKGDLGRRQTFAERLAQLGSDDGDLASRIFANARQNLDQTQQGLDTAAPALASLADGDVVVGVSMWST